MAVAELVHRGVSEVVGSRASEITPNRANEVVGSRADEPLWNGYRMLRMVRSDRGVARGSYKETKEKVKVPGRGRGRPRVYNGTDRRIVAAALKHYGYTKGLEFLKKERNLKVSMTLARSVAEENGLTFKKGRPAA